MPIFSGEPTATPGRPTSKTVACGVAVKGAQRTKAEMVSAAPATGSEAEAASSVAPAASVSALSGALKRSLVKEMLPRVELRSDATSAAATPER